MGWGGMVWSIRDCVAQMYKAFKHTLYLGSEFIKNDGTVFITTALLFRIGILDLVSMGPWKIRLHKIDELFEEAWSC